MVHTLEFEHKRMPNDVIDIETTVIGEKNPDHIMSQVKGTRSCDFCGKDFRQEFLLQLHVQIHAGVKRFYSVCCNLGFTTKGDLENCVESHMRSRIFLAKIVPKYLQNKQCKTLSSLVVILLK